MEIFSTIILLCCCTIFLFFILFGAFLALVWNNAKLRLMLIKGQTEELFSKYSFELVRRDITRYFKDLAKNLRTKKKDKNSEDQVEDAEFREVE